MRQFFRFSLRKSHAKTLSLFCAILPLLFTGCYSVFSGGTGGLVVDSESTATPKAGIANVDVYAYTSQGDRDYDFEQWDEVSAFVPKASYYGHTSTGTDGSFTLSRLVWKATNPAFGRDADYTTVYLLFYHENYGLTKGQTIITSDSASDTVYAELTAVRKTTVLSISIYDVASNALSGQDVLVSVSVPQGTDTLSAPARVYEQVISGSGAISISYPRWKNAAGRKAGVELTPEISISYNQSADEITWKACSNADNAAGDYSFLESGFSIKRTVKNSSYSISLYGKPCRLTVPAVNGTLGDTSSTNSDGKIIKMMAKDSTGSFSIDCGEATTSADTVGTSGTQTHGHFSGLGNGASWTDTEYTQRYSTVEVKFFVDGTDINVTKELRSDTPSYSFAL